MPFSALRFTKCYFDIVAGPSKRLATLTSVIVGRPVPRKPGQKSASKLLCGAGSGWRLGEIAHLARALSLPAGALGRTADTGGALLGSLGCREPHDDLTRYWVTDAQAATEVLKHVAHPVQDRDHLGTRGDEALEIPPLTDYAKGLVSRLDKVSAEKALERGSHLAMLVDEPLLVSRFYPKAHHIERRHVIPPSVTPYQNLL